MVGYVLGYSHFAFYANGRLGWVEELFVNEAFRRHNIGNSLMREFESWCRERQCQLVALATRRASQFYRSIGYDESATYFRKLL